MKLMLLYFSEVKHLPHHHQIPPHHPTKQPYNQPTNLEVFRLDCQPLLRCSVGLIETTNQSNLVVSGWLMATLRALQFAQPLRDFLWTLRGGLSVPWLCSLSLSGILSRVVRSGGVEGKEAMQCKRKTRKERAAAKVFARKGKVRSAVRTRTNENERIQGFSRRSNILILSGRPKRPIHGCTRSSRSGSALLAVDISLPHREANRGPGSTRRTRHARWQA
jgi:hypothetical protein